MVLFFNMSLYLKYIYPKLMNLENKSIKITGNITARMIPMDKPTPVIPLPISDFRKAFIVSPPYVLVDVSCLVLIIP